MTLAYSPDTEHVRAQYARMENYEYNAPFDMYLTTEGQRSAELFNIWLAEVRAEAFKEGADSVNNQCFETNVGPTEGEN
jgi:hypothetical protein